MLKLTGSPAPWTAFGTSYEVSAQLAPGLCFDIIREWIKTCDSHLNCASTTVTKLPRRVLDLGPHRFRNCISLIETKKGDLGTYMTLSHRWGIPEPTKTTRDTLAKRKDSIRLSSLPQTFRDAVAICRGLEVRFLWIDSLCILQDDKLDWEQESAKMAAVYAGSYLNIAATHAYSSTGGCFSKRWTTVDIRESVRKVPIKSYQIQEYHKGNCFEVHARVSLEAGHHDLEVEQSRQLTGRRAPLLTRAWVFQERCLARRTLHFHAQELIWECKFGLMCECRDLNTIYQNRKWYQGWKARHISWKAEDIQDLPDFWLEVVEGFSRLDLSHESDRLPALSGLASRFSGSRLSTYLAGLWKEDIGRALLWYVGPHWKSSSSRSLPLRAPTWSWASIDLANQTDHVMYPFLLRDSNGFNQDPCFRVVDVECRSSTINPYGEVQGGMLTIQCSFHSAIFVKRDVRAGNSSLVLDRNVEEDDLVIVSILIITPDVALDKSNSDEVHDSTVVFCLMVGSEPFNPNSNKEFDAYYSPESSQSDQESMIGTDYAVVIKASTHSNGFYERIGFLKTIHMSGEGYHNWFHKTSSGVFSIL